MIKKIAKCHGVAGRVGLAKRCPLKSRQGVDTGTASVLRAVKQMNTAHRPGDLAFGSELNGTRFSGVETTCVTVPIQLRYGGAGGEIDTDTLMNYRLKVPGETQTGGCSLGVNYVRGGARVIYAALLSKHR